MTGERPAAGPGALAPLAARQSAGTERDDGGGRVQAVVFAYESGLVRPGAAC